MLYQFLEEALYKQNIINVYACIAETDEDSEYLNHASQHFHAKRGSILVGWKNSYMTIQMKHNLSFPFQNYNKQPPVLLTNTRFCGCLFFFYET